MTRSTPGPAGEIAIVGVSCRFPGGIESLDQLWAALRDERDLVTEIPASRFEATRFLDRDPARPGHSYTVAGGFLDDVSGFDAEFFGMSPREATSVDPQQRLMLELAVEAVDDAGIDPAALAGSRSAVYAGVSFPDYGELQWLDPARIGPYTSSGRALSNVPNRVSHFFDFHGPSVVVDTACSSSLVAVHEACAWLQRDEGRVALAGGVHLALSPLHFVGFAKASMLSRAGRCRTFSAHADGFVRAEGGGVVVLKRLADALADGDRIHAVVVGSGVNSDGRTQGLSLPNPRAQESLLTEVYRRAQVRPDQLVYLEAHGTGTPVGDPIECEAIGRALGVHRERPLPVGSVKSNFGHLEPASGIAALLKSVTVLRHATVPATLHCLPLNPAIDFAALGLAPAQRPVPVEPGQLRPVVGVNSFGFGGTNAHVIVAEPPQPAPRIVPAAPRRLPVLISARSHAALTEAARRLGERLAPAGPEEYYDISFTTTRRGDHPHQAALLAASAKDASERLLAFAAGEGGNLSLDTRSADGRPVFVFSGNGS